MLNVENITKNVEMLKNVGTKINFFDANNFYFLLYISIYIFSALVIISFKISLTKICKILGKMRKLKKYIRKF